MQIYKDNVAMQFSYVIYENLKVCRLFQTIKPTNALMLNFFQTICHNSDMFRSVLIIPRELLNIIKAYMNTNYIFVYIL